ncbi:MAG: thioredoxin [Clostridia bacterium]|nr:thioredoxin [Clostridia bacterium]
MAEITLTKENFAAEVLSSALPVLVDFWADWCGPCKMIAPVVAKIAEEYGGKIRVGKVNVDDQSDLAREYGIMYIPTLIVFRNGEEEKRSSGFKRKDEIIELMGL